jgi:NCAIR mutase (PurE)-related protein
LVSNVFKTSSVTVVNINNGFGAGYAASLMNQLGRP